MKKHENTIPVRTVIVIAVVKNVDTLVVEIYVPHISSYAKLPRLPDGDGCLVCGGGEQNGH